MTPYRALDGSGRQKMAWGQKNNFPFREGFEKKSRSVKDDNALGIDGIVRCNHIGFNTGDSVFVITWTIARRFFVRK